MSSEVIEVVETEEAQEDLGARQQACLDEVNAVLQKHRCQFVIAVRIGEQEIPLAQVLNLPTRLVVVAQQ